MKYLEKNLDKLKEECGVFGILNNKDAATLTALGLHSLQHRGQEGCGIITSDGKNFYSEIGLFITGHKNITIRNNCRFMRHSSINADENSSIKIGNNISVNYNVNINSCNNGYIEIGDNVMIGQNTVLRASDHIPKDRNEKINNQSHTGGKIIIGNNVWIGANCVILKNVKIEDSSVIGAGTIVSRNVKKNEVIVGNQQRTLKTNV